MKQGIKFGKDTHRKKLQLFYLLDYSSIPYYHKVIVSNLYNLERKLDSHETQYLFDLYEDFPIENHFVNPERKDNTKGIKAQYKELVISVDENRIREVDDLFDLNKTQIPKMKDVKYLQKWKKLLPRKGTISWSQLSS